MHRYRRISAVWGVLLATFTNTAPTLDAVASTIRTPTRIIIVFGQSNANASAASNPFSTRQDGGSLMFEQNAVSAIRDGGCAGGSTVTSMTLPVDAGELAPLIETETEKPRSAIAGMLEKLTGMGAVTVTVAFGGYSAACLKRGTVPYQSILNAFENLKRKGVFKNHGVDAQLEVVWIQNEQDEILGTSAAAYAATMEELENDVNTVAGLYMATPFAHPIRFWMVQAQSWTDGTSVTTPTAAIGQYNVARAYPARFKLLGPTHPYPTAVGSTVHRNTLGACESAATWGEALSQGAAYQPVWPLMGESPTVSGSTITMRLYAPTCPLTFLTSKITGVSTTTRGLEYAGTGCPSITGVTLGSCASHVQDLTISLSGTPDATCKASDVLRGVFTGSLGAAAGPSTGPRSPICDSASETYQCGATEVVNTHCLVSFQETVSG